MKKQLSYSSLFHSLGEFLLFLVNSSLSTFRFKPKAPSNNNMFVSKTISRPPNALFEKLTLPLCTDLHRLAIDRRCDTVIAIVVSIWCSLAAVLE